MSVTCSECPSPLCLVSALCRGSSSLCCSSLACRNSQFLMVSEGCEPLPAHYSNTFLFPCTVPCPVDLCLLCCGAGWGGERGPCLRCLVWEHFVSWQGLCCENTIMCCSGVSHHVLSSLGLLHRDPELLWDVRVPGRSSCHRSAGYWAVCHDLCYVSVSRDPVRSGPWTTTFPTCSEERRKIWRNKTWKRQKKLYFFLTKWDREKKIKRKKEGCNIWMTKRIVLQGLELWGDVHYTVHRTLAQSHPQQPWSRSREPPIALEMDGAGGGEGGGAQLPLTPGWAYIHHFIMF